jgi:hypothetical protein
MTRSNLLTSTHGGNGITNYRKCSGVSCHEMTRVPWKWSGSYKLKSLCDVQLTSEIARVLVPIHLDTTLKYKIMHLQEITTVLYASLRQVTIPNSCNTGSGFHARLPCNTNNPALMQYWLRLPDGGEREANVHLNCIPIALLMKA